MECKTTISLITSPQSNLRRARRSSADKTNSKLLGSHSPSMLTVRSTSCIWPPRRAVLLLMSQWRCCVCFVTFFSHEFLFKPHFDLEPDYITRKGIRHRIQQYTVHMEILPTFHTRVECIFLRNGPNKWPWRCGLIARPVSGVESNAFLSIVTSIETNACPDAE